MPHSVWLVILAAISHVTGAQAESYAAYARPNTPGVAIGFAADMLRSGGSADPLADYTVGAPRLRRQPMGVRDGERGVGEAGIAHSLLVGVEVAIVNEEPGNLMPKIASNAVIKNRADDAPPNSVPMNANSIAYWVTAQLGTGFERGLTFGRNSLLAVGKRPAAIDLSDLPDEAIGQIDLIRIRRDVALRYDPLTRQLVLHIDPPGAVTAAP